MTANYKPFEDQSLWYLETM